MDAALIHHIKRLGYGGLMPFVALLAALLLFDDKHAWHGTLVDLIFYYAVIIVTFVGGLNWGIGLSDQSYSVPQRQVLLSYSVVPSLLAWVCLFMPASTGLILLALLYLACFGIDTKLTLPNLPEEYKLMRRRLSFTVSGVLILASQLV